MVAAAMARPAALVTTASRPKAIAGFVERTLGARAKEELFELLSLPPEALADETSPVALSSYLAGLAWLAERAGEGALLRLTEDLLDDENLGVFAPLLRTHDELEKALAQPHLFAPIRGLSIIETISIEAGRCSIRFRTLAIDNERLLRLAHAAELVALCRLYGFENARIDLRDDTTLLLRWRSMRHERWPLAGLAACLASFAISFRTGLFVMLAALATVVVFLRERAHRIESRAQRHRIRVLERGLSLSRRPPKPTEGQLFAGAYRLGPLLGIGANGAVHRAIRLRDDAPVAIKLLRHAAAHDELAADRLRREAEALALSRHPNVVELYDHGHVEGEVAYLVLELLEGGEPLSELLAREASLSAERLFPLALGICDALVAMHAAGVVHRDLKPSNVFVGVRDGAPFVKLFDFGIAHVEWAETRLTEPGRPLGTPGYRSPEQAEGRATDARTDIYAFGILLKECLTGQRPEEGESRLPPLEHRSSGIERTPHPLPPGFRELIERATAYEPEDRFPDARSLRRALLSIETSPLRKAQ